MIDLILPDGVMFVDTNKTETNIDHEDEEEVESKVFCDLTKLTHVFIVMEIEKYDLKTMLEMNDIEFDE